MKTTKQRMRMEIKEISSAGEFDGLLSVYNVVDLGKDLVEPGAFTKTIQEHGAEVPLLWQHQTANPIGKLSLVDGPDALHVKGQLLMELPQAQQAYLLIKSGIVKGLSIGYDTVKDAMDGTVRRLKELRLWEGSIVTFPMLPQALITAVKARGETKEDFNTELAEIQLCAMGEQMFNALYWALMQLPWASGLTRDQKVTSAEATLQQFSDAFTGWLPTYIDYLTEEYGDMETMSAPEIETKRMERKVGRMISATNKTKLATVQEHTKSIDDIIAALIEDEAVDDDENLIDTSKSKAAAEEKSEPVPDHSAAQTLIEGIRSLIPTAQAGAIN
jgi:HK97 family phage prohead protease